MSKQQYFSGPKVPTRSRNTLENPLFQLPAKEQIFSNHLSKLNNSRANNTKQSNVTLSSEYEATFQNYTKNISLIDKIVETFDNGNISDLAQERPQFTHSQIFLHLPKNIQGSIEEINDLYFVEEKYSQLSYEMPLNHENYSKILSKLKEKPFEQEQIKQIKMASQDTNLVKPLVAKSETVATHHPQLQTKIDLLLNQIMFQKKRMDCPMYFQAMEMKLTEFIDYVLSDDDKYIGLSLQDKAKEILNEINKFKGKVVDGWLALVLIEIFFQEFKELQVLKVEILRNQRKKTELKYEVKSQIDAKSEKSNHSSIKKGKYSQPNSRRSNIQEQDWMGALK